MSQHIPVAEALACGCKLAKLMTNHLFRDRHRDVVLAVVNKELEPTVSTSLARTQQSLAGSCNSARWYG